MEFEWQPGDIDIGIDRTSLCLDIFAYLIVIALVLRHAFNKQTARASIL